MNQLNERDMQLHVNIVGWLLIIGSLLFFMAAIFVFTLLTGIGAASGDPVAVRVLATVGTAVGILLTMLAVPGVIAGYGLLNRASWSRVLGIVIGFLNLINFPLGTAVGIYTLWVLLQENAADYFITPTLKPA